MGQKRAQNGAARPFGIRLWAVGNEMYGDWQIGHMPLEKYVAKHREVVDAMRAVDPSIRPVGVGAVGEWSRTMLGQAAAHMSLISEHLYWQNKDDVVAHVEQVPSEIRAWPRRTAPTGASCPRSRATRSRSRSTSGTSGTARTSTANSARATS